MRAKDPFKTSSKREADDELYQKLEQGNFCYVLNSRQSGKSSLRVRTMSRLTDAGVECASIDLSSISIQSATQENWYADVIVKLIDSFDLNVDFQKWWEKNLLNSPLLQFRNFLEKILLAEIQENIVIFIDEIDSVLSLNFPTDDFFAFIRSCYNQRVDNPNYNRLTFCLLGVASPSNLIEDKRRTPFNIGKAISLKGFQLHEVEPLEKGLRERYPDSQAVMKDILHWTGGQPFLTQKLCQFMVEESLKDNARTVEQMVRSRIIENWESLDEPEHLRTIRDRLLSNKQRATRLLGLYQQILQHQEVPANGSFEQMELRLSGLVVKQQSCLKVYNRIYKAVFDQFWVEQRLAQQRPYSDQLKAWLDSKCQDKSRLLQGNALQDAITWADSKSLTDEDYKFLNASQEELNKLRNHRQKVTRLWAATMTVTVAGICGWLFWLSKTPYILYPDRFSQGERSFFLSEENSGVLNGIKAFKQKKFIEAEAFFQRAIDANFNDPELMIYKNNSKAWTKGNPFTL